MTPHLDDTIAALSTAPGPGGRAVVRLSGPDAANRGAVFSARKFRRRRPALLLEGEVRLPGVAAPLPADLYLWPAPHTYTGQDIAEMHTLSCPPLVELLVAAAAASRRAGRRGRASSRMRAFLAGKLDLTRAEAVLGVIEAGDADELKQALTQLAGGMARPLQELRDDLLNLLADVEAGLDFADEDIHFVGREDLLLRLTRGWPS